MPVVQGAFSQLLSPGLAAVWKQFYLDNSDTEPGTADNNINTRRVVRPVRELHVYDLGDGMLVPFQLVDDLFD